jgi:hypothetical protein
MDGRNGVVEILHRLGRLGLLTMKRSSGSTTSTSVRWDDLFHETKSIYFFGIVKEVVDAIL